jgi:hypothetical protein
MGFHYDEFDIKQAREDMVEITEVLARYIKERDIENVILLDRAARPSYMGLIKVWNKMFPEEKRPEIYFVNPEGFKTWNGRKREDVLEDFRKSYPKLAESKGNAMIFDVCIHNGDDINPVLKTLKMNGYPKVYVGVSQNAAHNMFGPPKEFPYVDFLTKNSPTFLCCPFGTEWAVTKGKSVTSERAFPAREKKGEARWEREMKEDKSDVCRAEAFNLRKEISMIFKEKGY